MSEGDVSKELERTRALLFESTVMCESRIVTLTEALREIATGAKDLGDMRRIAKAALKRVGLPKLTVLGVSAAIAHAKPHRETP